jgi:hypothetical protein
VTAATGKACSRCEKVKPLEDFHLRADRPDGRQSRCKACVSELAGERDLEAKRARARAWSKADAVTRARHSRTWNKAYRDALKAEGLEP